MAILRMQECPRYDRCSAPVCPLDAEWRRRYHMHEDRVCLWLTELSKPEGLRRVTGELGAETVRSIAEILPAVAASSYAIRHKLSAASQTGSKLEGDRARLEKAREEQRRRRRAGEETQPAA